jgi:hypothetical protein
VEASTVSDSSRSPLARATYLTYLPTRFLRFNVKNESVLMQSDAVASALIISESSTIDVVCAWAARAVAEGGVGLSAANVDILRGQEIDGEVLFNLTDAKLEKIGLVMGPREKLLAAVDRIHRTC